MKAPAEVQSLRTADGAEVIFPNGEYAMLSFGGYGAPPVEYKTQRYPRQDGATEVGYNLLPRTLTVELFEKHARSRQAYWDNRAALHNLLRPNRGVMTLTVLRPDGSKRAIQVRPQPGLEFAAAPEENAWTIREALDLIADDPTWYDPSDHVISAISANPLELTFPATFGITFGSSNLIATTGQFVYAGSWRTYPTITLAGAYATAQLFSSASRALINLVKATTAEDRRIIVLEPGNLSVTDQNGDSKFGDVDPGSNLVDFAILPVPEAPGGINEISVQMMNARPGGSITVSYNDRFIGI